MARTLAVDDKVSTLMGKIYSLLHLQFVFLKLAEPLFLFLEA